LGHFYNLIELFIFFFFFFFLFIHSAEGAQP